MIRYLCDRNVSHVLSRSVARTRRRTVSAVTPLRDCPAGCMQALARSGGRDSGDPDGPLSAR